MEENILLKLEINANQSITSINELIQQNKELAQILRDAPKQGEKGFEELSDVLKENSKRFADNRKEILEFNRDLREVEVAADSMIGLSRTLRTLESEYKLLGKAAREGIDGQKQADEILKIRTELKKLEKDLGDNRRNVGNYQEAIENAFGSNSPLASAVIQIRDFGASAALGLGVGLALDVLADFGAEMSEAVQRFRDLRGAIRELTGAGGGDLDQFAIGINAVAVTFKKDSATIIEATNALSKRLGIGFGEALTQVEQGLLANQNQSDKFLDSLREYPAVLANATDDVELLAKISTEGTRGGFFTDKLEDSIKEADLALKENQKSISDTLRILGSDFADKLANDVRTGAISTIDAIKRISDRGNELGIDLQTIQEITANVFKSAGEDVGGFGNVVDVVFRASNKSLEDYIDNTNEVVRVQQINLQSVKQLGAAQNELSKSLSGLGASETSIFNRIKEFGFEFADAFVKAAAIVKFFFAGLQSGYQEIEREIGLFTDRLRIRGLQFQRTFTINSEQRNELESQINSLTSNVNRRASFAGKSFGEAFNEGFDDARREFNERRSVFANETEAKVVAKKLGEGIGESIGEGIGESIESTSDIIADEIEKILIDASSLGSVFDKLQISAEAQNSIKQTTDEIRKLLEVIRSGGVLLDESLSEQSLQGIERIKKQLKESAQLRTDAAQKELQEREAIQQFAINSARQLADTIFDIRTQAIDRQLDRELDALDERTERDLELVEDNADLTRQVNERADREREELEREAFERAKRLSIAQAAISGALAILSTLAAIPGPIDILSLGTIRALQVGAIALTTGLQIAAISSQDFAEGGMVDWGEDSHAKGGSKARVRRGGDVRNIEMHKGESMYVVSGDSTGAQKQALSDRNQMYGGKAFVGTSILTSDRRRQIMAMDELIYKGTTGKPFVNVKYPTPPKYQNGGEVGLSGKGETVNVMMSDAQFERMERTMKNGIESADLVNTVIDEIARRELLANEQSV